MHLGTETAKIGYFTCIIFSRPTLPGRSSFRNNFFRGKIVHVSRCLRSRKLDEIKWNTIRPIKLWNRKTTYIYIYAAFRNVLIINNNRLSIPQFYGVYCKFLKICLIFLLTIMLNFFLINYNLKKDLKFKMWKQNI